MLYTSFRTISAMAKNIKIGLSFDPPVFRFPPAGAKNQLPIPLSLEIHGADPIGIYIILLLLINGELMHAALGKFWILNLRMNGISM